MGLGSYWRFLLSLGCSGEIGIASLCCVKYGFVVGLGIFMGIFFFSSLVYLGIALLRLVFLATPLFAMAWHLLPLLGLL
jgi:hypothetical protein